MFKDCYFDHKLGKCRFGFDWFISPISASVCILLGFKVLVYDCYLCLVCGYD